MIAAGGIVRAFPLIAVGAGLIAVGGLGIYTVRSLQAGAAAEATAEIVAAVSEQDRQTAELVEDIRATARRRVQEANKTLSMSQEAFDARVAEAARAKQERDAARSQSSGQAITNAVQGWLPPPPAADPCPLDCDLDPKGEKPCDPECPLP